MCKNCNSLLFSEVEKHNGMCWVCTRLFVSVTYEETDLMEVGTSNTLVWKKNNKSKVHKVIDDD